MSSPKRIAAARQIGIDAGEIGYSRLLQLLAVMVADDERICAGNAAVYAIGVDEKHG